METYMDTDLKKSPFPIPKEKLSGSRHQQQFQLLSPDHARKVAQQQQQSQQM